MIIQIYLKSLSHTRELRCYISNRYMKGTVEHGTILGAVDEIVMTLDDNSMNLQSMSASRYVGPFLEKVQKWEKSLSHISEVVEVNNVVKSYTYTYTTLNCFYEG